MNGFTECKHYIRIFLLSLHFSQLSPGSRLLSPARKGLSTVKDALSLAQRVLSPIKSMFSDTKCRLSPERFYKTTVINTFFARLIAFNEINSHINHKKRMSPQLSDDILCINLVFRLPTSDFDLQIIFYVLQLLWLHGYVYRKQLVLQ